MRKLLFFIPVFAVVVYFSCNTAPVNTQPSINLLNDDSLKAENFTININTDTLLHTINGTWLRIDKGTFSSDNGKVVLEVKEALPMQQIVKAGLLTQSNGQPLASGGMLYINAAAGQKVTINKPFKVAVPSASLDKNMQLYKGEKDATGKINWKDPKTIADNALMGAVKKGEVLFQQKCASCHGIGKEGSGPDLAHIWERKLILEDADAAGYEISSHDFRKKYVTTVSDSTKKIGGEGWLIQHDEYVHYPNAYVCNLMNLFNNQEINLSADVEKNRKDWIKIYQYINNETNRRNLPYPRHAYLDSCLDSCNLYQRLKSELEIKKSTAEAKRKELIKGNGSLAERKMEQTPQRNTMPPPPGFVNSEPEKDKVKPEDYTATYYEFTIETFGWYNIDVLLKTDDNIKHSELFVRITGVYHEKLKLYLIIPGMKVLLEGGPTEKNNDEYAFYNKDGTIPLPQNTKAYILALTETEKLIAFSVKEFIPQLKQAFEITLTESTKQEFYAAIDNMGASGFNIDINNSKNSAAIKDADKTIQQLQEELKKAENLKPKRCDCDCGQQAPATTEVTSNEDDYIINNIGTTVENSIPDDKKK